VIERSSGVEGAPSSEDEKTGQKRKRPAAPPPTPHVPPPQLRMERVNRLLSHYAVMVAEREALAQAQAAVEAEDH
jgi:hypothetical protein